jgi:hypothetical protein
VSIGRDFINFISEIIPKEDAVSVLELFEKFTNNIIEKGVWQST